jgi:restriction system protein
MKSADLPTYSDLMLPTLRAVAALGGSGSAREIREKVIADLGPTEEELSVTYENADNPKSVWVDRQDWARSYCKLAGVLDSPRRGLFLITPLGKEVLAAPEAEALDRIRALDAEVKKARSARRKVAPDTSEAVAPEDDEVDEDSARSPWKPKLLARLHRLSPDAFEEFSLYVLRSFGLELTRVGGVGDEGIDGIGTAPLSPVLSATVAVQAKRYDPTKSVGRGDVALFQRDASAAGAERAVMVTLARYSPAAQKAATTATPTVDLIDGDRLCQLVKEQGLGVRLVPDVDESWFDRFEQ